MSMTTLEAFARGTETFNAHDVNGFADVLADEVTFTAPGGARGAGKSACAGYFAGWFDAFPDAHVDVRDLHVLDDVAVEIGVFTGTHDGPLGELPPTGRRVAVDYVQVLRIRDGKHVSFELMFDRLAMFEQLGLA